MKQSSQSQGASCRQWPIPWQKTQRGEWPFCCPPEGSVLVGVVQRCNPWKGHARTGSMSAANALGLPFGLRRDAASLVPQHLERSAPVIITLNDH